MVPDHMRLYITSEDVHTGNPAFRAQCAEVSELIICCSTIISGIAAAREDAKMIFDDLRRRLLREWEPHQYDALIEDAATRMGETINARPLAGTVIYPNGGNTSHLSLTTQTANEKWRG